MFYLDYEPKISYNDYTKSALDFGNGRRNPTQNPTATNPLRCAHCGNPANIGEEKHRLQDTILGKGPWCKICYDKAANINYYENSEFYMN